MSHSLRVADHVILKLLKVLAEKPQCKSLSNARNVSTDPTLRMLPKDFVFQLKVTVLGLRSARTEHTHSVGHVSTWAWVAGLGLEIHMHRLLQEPPRTQMTDVQHHTCSSTGGVSKTWEACPGLPMTRHWAGCKEQGMYVHDMWGYQPTAQGTAFLEVKPGIMRTTHSETLKL